MLRWLNEKGPERLDKLFREARAYAVRYVGPKVYFRGIIEFSNLCVKDCYYCGIRKSNSRVTRFTMDENEILKCALAAQEMN